MKDLAAMNELYADTAFTTLTHCDSREFIFMKRESQ